jgi:hypothetical protein
MALRLHAVTPTETNAGSVTAPEGSRAVVYRDLAAIVTDRDRFALENTDPAAIADHRAVIDAVYRRQVVLPAPPGIIFRTEHVLCRWMELHYVTLNDAVAFVSERNAARVHVHRVDASVGPEDAGADLAEHAGEVFRILRRRSVASVPLTIEKFTGIALSSAFLVERELWKEFERGVEEARAANPKLRIDLTGPWAPYDFIRMQFGD